MQNSTIGSKDSLFFAELFKKCHKHFLHHFIHYLNLLICLGMVCCGVSWLESQYLHESLQKADIKSLSLSDMIHFNMPRNLHYIHNPQTAQLLQLLSILSARDSDLVNNYHQGIVSMRCYRLFHY
jgi:hypothetical protein